MQATGYHQSQELGQLTEAFFSAASEKRVDADPQIIGAFAVAAEIHESQRYKGRPVIHHLLRVATRIMDWLEVDNPEIVATALLKNSINDRSFEVGRLSDSKRIFLNQFEARDVASSELERLFGRDVAENVGHLTKPVVPKDQFHDRNRIYNDHVDFIIKNYPKARIIVLADFMDYFGAEDTSIRRYYREKRDRECFDRFQVHIDGLSLPDSMIDEPLRTEVRKELKGHETDARRRMGLDQRV